MLTTACGAATPRDWSDTNCLGDISCQRKVIELHGIITPPLLVRATPHTSSRCPQCFGERFRTEICSFLPSQCCFKKLPTSCQPDQRVNVRQQGLHPDKSRGKNANPLTQDRSSCSISARPSAVYPVEQANHCLLHPQVLLLSAV